MTRIILFFALCLQGLVANAQSSAFRFISPGPDLAPATGQIAVLDEVSLRSQLVSVPLEGSVRKSTSVLRLPLPDGSFAEFTAISSPLLKSRKEYGSYRLSGPWGSGRLAVSPKGISGVLRGPEGRFVLEALPDEVNLYRVVAYRDFTGEEDTELLCGFGQDKAGVAGRSDVPDVAGTGAAKSAGDPRELRQYDLIMTNTGEFGQAVGGDTSDVLDAFNTAVNAVNAIYEPELGMRINLVEVKGLIFLDPATDPYVNARDGRELLPQIFEFFADSNIPVSLYDIGHILTRGCDDNLGGIARRGSACTNARSQGVTCVSGSVQRAALSIMTHELGHQFSATHSWNNCPRSQDQRSAGTAFEPGSGSTIMSYAGSCGTQNIGADDAYFHGGNLQQILRFTREGTAADCATIIDTENISPEVSLSYGDNFHIPINTPFRLEGTATDANGDELLYNWEQFDLGDATVLGDPTVEGPLFRSVPPSPNGNVRYFPRLDRIVNDVSSPNEVLPAISRELTFRLTARDYHPVAGGADWEEVKFFSNAVAGPFTVNDPDQDLWRVGENRTVSWNVANTDQAPVDCQSVDILLSTDGGETFEVVLATNVPNVGEAGIIVPPEAISSTARIMVAAAENIFFNVNAQPFQVAAAVVPGFTLAADNQYIEACIPTSVDIAISSGNVLDFTAPISLSLEETDLPPGVSFALASDRINPGESTTLTVDLTDLDFDGRLSFNLVGTASGQEPIRRRIVMDLINADFSDLSALAPTEGTRDIMFTTDFFWTKAENAELYEYQLSTTPVFAPEDIVEQAFSLVDTTYSLEDLLEASTVYYWRVRPINECGEGDWLDPASFQTEILDCTLQRARDTPIALPGSGPDFVKTSTIFIEEQGTISDVNIPDIQVSYNFVSRVSLSLISPAGTRVELYRENCQISTGLIDLGFDDEAPTKVSCPTTGNRVVQPVGSLADFIGEDTFGEWTLEVEVSETNGTVGSFERWELEFCSAPRPVQPEQLVNGVTEVPPLEKNAILEDKLRATGEGLSPVDLIYTLTALPSAGRLLLYRDELRVGDRFSQADINGAGLFYENTSGEAGNDAFGFVLTTPARGYQGVTYHAIEISADATVSNRSVSPLANSLQVYPNPVAERLNFRWTASIDHAVPVALYDLNGRLLREKTVPGLNRTAELSVRDLPAGVYLVRIDGIARRIIKR